MGDRKRFYVIFERHIGLGVRWETCDPDWRIAISLGFPFVSVVMCFWKRN